MRKVPNPKASKPQVMGVDTGDGHREVTVAMLESSRSVSESWVYGGTYHAHAVVSVSVRDSVVVVVAVMVRVSGIVAVSVVVIVD